MAAMAAMAAMQPQRPQRPASANASAKLPSTVPPIAPSLEPSPPSPQKSARTPRPGGNWTAAAKSSGPKGARHHDEVKMDGFIKNQLAVLLQPFRDHVQRLDVRLSQLQVQHDMTNHGMQTLRENIAKTDKKADELLIALTRTDDSVAKVRESVERHAVVAQQLRCDHEVTDVAAKESQKHSEMAHEKISAYIGSSGELMRQMRAEMKKSLDNTTRDLKGTQQKHAEDLVEVSTHHHRANNELVQLRAVQTEAMDRLAETKSVTGENSAKLSGLASRSNELSSEARRANRSIESLKEQQGQTQTELQRILEAISTLLERRDQHDGQIKFLQQDHETCQGRHERIIGLCSQTLHGQEVLSKDIEATKGGLTQANKGVTEANLEATGLRRNLMKVQSDIGDITERILGLGHNHTLLKKEVEAFKQDLTSPDEDDGLPRTSKDIEKAVAAGIASAVGKRDQVASKADVQKVRKEIDRAIELQDGVRTQINDTNFRVDKLTDESEKQGEEIHKLGESLECCHAGLSGLTSGFAETSAQLEASGPEGALQAHNMHDLRLQDPEIARDVGLFGSSAASRLYSAH